MKLILFLSSGISRPSGLLGVHELTTDVLNGEWFYHTDGRFYPGAPGAAQVNDPTEILQKFLSLLAPSADRCHPLDGQKGNYEDLYFLAEQIADNARGQVDNPAIHPFVSQLKEQVSTLTNQPLGQIADLACSFIRSVVAQRLASPPQIQGLDLIESLARSRDFERVDIVTLNHDVLIEDFLHQKEIPFVDGFTGPDGNVRYFDPDLFESATKVRLFKLHGSINWYRFRLEHGNPFSDRFGIIAGIDAQEAPDSQGTLTNQIDVLPWIIAGTHAKAVQYSFGIHADMHFWFHRLLREHNAMAMSGYGWSDRVINGRLMEWLHSGIQPRLILMHKHPGELAQFSKSKLWDRYQPLVKAGRIIPIPKWMQDVGTEEVRKHLISTPA
ncbi:MAG: hypothetical protein ACREIC_12415 [Limisphaerales bacterium]